MEYCLTREKKKLKITFFSVQHIWNSRLSYYVKFDGRRNSMISPKQGIKW